MRKALPTWLRMSGSSRSLNMLRLRNALPAQNSNSRELATMRTSTVLIQLASSACRLFPMDTMWHAMHCCIFAQYMCAPVDERYVLTSAAQACSCVLCMLWNGSAELTWQCSSSQRYSMPFSTIISTDYILYCMCSHQATMQVVCGNQRMTSTIPCMHVRLIVVRLKIRCVHAVRRACQRNT